MIDPSRPRLARRAAAAPAALLLLVLLPACAPAIAVDGARMQQRVERQVAAGPRIPGTPGHDAIAAWIDSTLEALGARVERQAFTDSTLGRPIALTNLIGRYGPSQGPAIALLAHWDSRPWCDQDPDTTWHLRPLPGANDGGSGVAVLLEVAELLHRHPPGVPIQLVFLDGEDQGRASAADEFCLGARGYARLAPSGSVKGAFLFDMVGDRNLEIHPELNSVRRASNLAQLVVEGAGAVHAGHFHPEPRWELIDDHIPLLDAGIPAADIIDFDYPAWHTHLDTPERTSAASLAEVARVAYWLVTRSALARP